MKPTVDAARDHWRRQLLLTIVTVVVGIGSLSLTALSVARERGVHYVTTVDGQRHRSVSYLVTMWPAAVAALAVLIVVCVLLVHAYRVALFTFRTDPSSRGEAC